MDKHCHTVTTSPRAYCPWCSVRMPLRSDGTLPFHGDISGRCFGSEKKPDVQSDEQRGTP